MVLMDLILGTPLAEMIFNLDIFGKVTGQPISRLLGGRYRDRIKPYGSLLMTDPEALPPRLETAVERGFRAIKMKVGRPELGEDLSLVHGHLLASRLLH